MITKSEQTEKELEKNGWIYDRTSTNKYYKAAGSTSQMQNRNGYEYIRVYTSECKGKEKYQLTHVYKRKIK